MIDLSLAVPRSAVLRASLWKFQRATSLKFDLPLVELEVAREDIEGFMQNHLQELSSRMESQEQIKELTKQLSQHNNRIWELLQNPELAQGEVSQLVLVGLLAQQPIEVNFFPGILEGLVGRLGLALPEAVNLPSSIKEGVMRRWATALRQAALESSSADQGPASGVTPHGLHLDYDMDF